MIGQTEAFLRYKANSQRYLDFVVLVATAVPTLRQTLDAQPATIATPDYFRQLGRDSASLRALIKDYQNQLASSSVVTLFSYFEEYVRGALQEIVDFHGGNQAFLALSKDRSSRFFGPLTPSIRDHKRKLQEHPKKGKVGKYRKHSSALTHVGFSFPTDLLAPFGASALLGKLDPKRGFKAWEIPDIVEGALMLGITPKARSRLAEIRTLRNTIAHGTVASVTIKRAMSMGHDLRATAVAIDNHVVEHFLVLERYA